MIFLTLLQHQYIPFGTYFSVYFHTLTSLIHFALGYQNTAHFPRPGYYSNRIFLSLVAAHCRHQKKNLPLVQETWSCKSAAHAEKYSCSTSLLPLQLRNSKNPSLSNLWLQRMHNRGALPTTSCVPVTAEKPQEKSDGLHTHENITLHRCY